MLLSTVRARVLLKDTRVGWRGVCEHSLAFMTILFLTFWFQDKLSGHRWVCFCSIKAWGRQILEHLTDALLSFFWGSKQIGLCVLLKPHPLLNCLYLFKGLSFWPEVFFLWNCKGFISFPFFSSCEQLSDVFTSDGNLSKPEVGFLDF